MPFGKKCRQSWIECLKKQVIKTPISLFVPKSMFEEEKNAEGFAKNAIVTHYRLKNDPDKP
jgi:hypothetical protein